MDYYIFGILVTIRQYGLKKMGKISGFYIAEESISADTCVVKMNDTAMCGITRLSSPVILFSTRPNKIRL
jgi:hypothetical protein